MPRVLMPRRPPSHPSAGQNCDRMNSVESDPFLPREKKQLDGWKNVDRSLDKVDGSEIRRSPVEVGSCCLYLQGFSSIPDGAGFLPSTINSITRSWNRPSIWYTHVCFNWMIVPSLRMENGWKSSFPSIQKKTGWLSGTKFIILMA